MTPFWISAFLDISASDHAVAAEFWTAVTGMPAAYDEELAFWEATTGFPLDPRQRHPEVRLLVGPDDQPLQLLIQRLDDGDGPTSAHLDVGTSAGGRTADVARHLARGATVRREHERWTVLTDPAGMAYCLTDHPVV